MKSCTHKHYVYIYIQYTVYNNCAILQAITKSYINNTLRSLVFDRCVRHQKIRWRTLLTTRGNMDCKRPHRSDNFLVAEKTAFEIIYVADDV